MPDSNTLTFLCLHNWAGAGHEFDAIAERLRPAYSLLAPDLGGFGNAPAPEGGYTLAAYADEVLSLATAHNLQNYVLVGHSMGGKIALLLAARQPAGLRGVVLLSPSPPTPEPMTDEDRAASLHAWGQRAEIEKIQQKTTARALPEAVRQQVIADSLRTSKAAWDAWLLHGSRENIAAHLGRVQVPCAIFAGDEDKVMSPSVHGLETLPLLPESTPLEIIGGAGHLLPYEAPGEVAELLRNFARRL